MPERTVVILQSNYIPWKGYFDLMRGADLFVFYDDVQYTKNDWRNRNRIKTPNGASWLTIPAGSDLNRRICDVEIPDQRWKRKHRTSIQQNYAKAPCFKANAGLLDLLYDNDISNLSQYNQHTIRYIANEVLGFETTFADSREFAMEGAKTDRLIDLLKATEATRYISGPSAKAYLEESAFAQAGIELEYFSYAGYPEYPQLFPPFEHAVSILDLIFNTGEEASKYMLTSA